MTSSQPTPKPKIYIWCEEYELLDGNAWCGCATAEDGTKLAEHWSKTKLWVRHDMGLTSKQKHRLYNEYYPDGWELVDLVDLTSDELDEHEGLMTAIDRGDGGSWRPL